ncbi:ribbon-helix-helix protein, CopG family [Gilliamella sp. Pas-s25]|uniref:ribbon-helix-helix protein, CopG family n=1 Tax=Gilliamella sp. Pas-s25 TaxID=2687310 RepID=UPI00135DA52C|nr:ribbon-helix-helix protein, CopG family [Gilliamella sp. Pas-s25]MWP63320.1 ribbon-helix-helix protein, CopG family [Gilliamella sp. Pas-s25]
MALTRAEINERSNEKRGIKNKAFKLNIDDIAMIKQTALDLDISEAKLVVEAIKFYRENKKAS